MKPFEFIINDVSAAGNHRECEVKGYLDAHTVTQFEDELDHLIQDGTNQVIINLNELNYISSAGIGAIMGLTQKLRKQGGELILLSPSEKVFSILDLLGFTHIFKIVNSEQEAQEALKV